MWHFFAIGRGELEWLPSLRGLLRTSDALWWWLSSMCSFPKKDRKKIAYWLFGVLCRNTKLTNYKILDHWALQRIGGSSVTSSFTTCWDGAGEVLYLKYCRLAVMLLDLVDYTKQCALPWALSSSFMTYYGRSSEEVYFDVHIFDSFTRWNSLTLYNSL